MYDCRTFPSTLISSLVQRMRRIDHDFYLFGLKQICSSRQYCLSDYAEHLSDYYTFCDSLKDPSNYGNASTVLYRYIKKKITTYIDLSRDLSSRSIHQRKAKWLKGRRRRGVVTTGGRGVDIVTDITRAVGTRRLSVVTIVEVFSLVSRTVVTIHPRVSTKTDEHAC